MLDIGCRYSILDEIKSTSLPAGRREHKSTSAVRDYKSRWTEYST